MLKQKRLVFAAMLIMIFQLIIPVNSLHSVYASEPEYLETNQADGLQKLRVSDNGRYIVKEDGTPFFYLGDTAWGIYPALTIEEAEIYLEDRAQKNFTVIQTTLVGDLTRPNRYGHNAFMTVNPDLPYSSGNPYDPTKPNEAYFEHVDAIINLAEAKGIYVGIVPIWASNIVKTGSIFNEDNIRSYGQFLGARYKDKPVIWILGGDSNPVEGTIDSRPIWRAMAEGLEAGDEGSHLMTYHPKGGGRSAMWFHNDPWLDFNMNQSGHSRNRSDYSMIDMVTTNYSQIPPKPTIDGESGYEGIAEGLSDGGRRSMTDDVDPKDKLSAYDVRTKAYWSIFAGSFGHTYGSNAIYQFARESNVADWRWDPDMTWEEALDLPGAIQMSYVRKLMESRPFLTRIPDQTLVAEGAGTLYDTVQATRDMDGSYAFIYSTSGKPFKVNMSKIAGPEVKAWWYNPRDGKSISIGLFSNTGITQFTPPTSGTDNDWVLVLDDKSRNYPVPGEKLGIETSMDTSINSETGKVIISGFVSAGRGGQITLKITDSQNRVIYLNQETSGDNGSFMFTHQLNAPGIYKAALGGDSLAVPLTKEFIYGSDNNIGVSLSGPDLINNNVEYVTGINLTGDMDVAACDITVNYDLNMFEYLDIIPVEEKTVIAAVYQSEYATPQGREKGVIRIAFARTGEQNNIHDTIEIARLKFMTLDTQGVGQIEIINAVIADSQGNEVQTSGYNKIITIRNSYQLQLAITNAQSLLNTAVEGFDTGMYPPGTKSLLEMAINQALDVVNNVNSTQEMINEALITLSSAVSKFEGLIITVSTGDLNGKNGITAGDLAIAAYNYGKNSQSTGWDDIKAADINGDGVIDIYDISFIARKVVTYY